MPDSMPEVRPVPRGQLHWVREIYNEAFPQRERKPVWMIRRYQRQGKMELLAVCEGGGAVGMAIAAVTADTVLLDYFAIEAHLRDRGLGGGALAALLQRYAGKQFFLEIESTELPSENHAQCLARKAFYLRNGLQDTGLRMDLFGVPMELLASSADLDWPACQPIYRLLYGPQYARHVVLTERRTV